ncbi:MAG: acyl-CoA thioesterase [Nevskia sp.]|uniref:acyl-CoA thioesterase n=1 Tax=Nevskia sp. TaxID=1929292 RepID=UPI0040360688
MPDRLDRLLTLLGIETLDANLFRGQSRDDGFKQLYGGQVVAQALVAATRTVPKDRPAQSLHAYFLRPGDLHLPIIYEVERIRDGGSFTTRRVQAIQNSVPIFSMMVSFHAPEDGWDHQPAMPEVPAPEVLKSGTRLFAEWQAGPPDVSPGLLGVQASRSVRRWTCSRRPARRRAASGCGSAAPATGRRRRNGTRCCWPMRRISI